MKVKLRILLVACVIATGLGAPVAAGPLEEGNAAYLEKEYAKAAELWGPLAERGTPLPSIISAACLQRARGWRRTMRRH